MSYIIETVNLTKKYPQTKSYRELFMHPLRRKTITALEKVNIQVNKGEIFGLLGPNGAGKTTIIKILCTLILPTEGSAFVNNYDVTREGDKIRKTFGYVISEERSFYWRLTGRQNLKFFAILNNLSGCQINLRIKEVVEITGLNDYIDKKFYDYSTGMKQKLAIARGLLTDPQILLLDEPTRSLDPVIANNLRRFIKDVIVSEQKKTVIIATNNLNEAEELCDRIAIIDKGKVKFCGFLEEVKRIINNNDRYVLRLQGTFNYLHEKIKSLNFNGIIVNLSPVSSSNNGPLCILKVSSRKDNISEIVERLITSGIKMESFYPEEFSLNEIFAKVTE